MRLRLHALPGLAGWGLRFLRECREERWRENTRATFALARLSLDAFRDLCAAEPALEFDRNPPGLLKLFRDELSMASAVRAAGLYRDLGLPLATLDADACVREEPALAPIRERIAGGVLYPTDESGDAYQFTRSLAARCVGLGVAFRHGVTVDGLESERGRITATRTSAGRLAADAIVLALGPQSPAVARTLGLRLPVYPAKGYSVTVEVDGWNRAPRRPIADDGRKAAVVPLGRRVRLAGTVEFAGHDTRLDAARGRMLLEALADILPECPRDGRVEHWAGLRPLTPDGRPILGPTRWPNLYLNTGHGPLGWTLACGSALALAALLRSGEPPVDLAPFAWPRPAAGGLS